jgi:hypothetical protein
MKKWDFKKGFPLDFLQHIYSLSNEVQKRNLIDLIINKIN